MPFHSVDEYLAALPEDRRAAISTLRATINAALPAGYEEGIQYGMIGWYVPHSHFPAGYHCDPKQPVPYLGLASQKNHMALYSFFLYVDPDLLSWFQQAWKARVKKLDMGKSCVRFKSLDQVPLEVVGQAVARAPLDAFLARYQAGIPRR